MSPERKPLSLSDLSADERTFLQGGNGFTPHPHAQPPAEAVNPGGGKSKRAGIEKEALEGGNDEPTVRFTVDIRKSMHRKLRQAAMDADMRMTELARVALADYLAGLED